MKVKESVKNAFAYFDEENKFDRRLKKALLLRGNEEYSTELFDQMFDQELAKARCQNDSRKGKYFTSRYVYCNICYKKNQR